MLEHEVEIALKFANCNGYRLSLSPHTGPVMGKLYIMTSPSCAHVKPRVDNKGNYNKIYPISMMDIMKWFDDACFMQDCESITYSLISCYWRITIHGNTNSFRRERNVTQIWLGRLIESRRRIYWSSLVQVKNIRISRAKPLFKSILICR